jgi:hypothetical protein
VLCLPLYVLKIFEIMCTEVNFTDRFIKEEIYMRFSQFDILRSVVNGLFNGWFVLC